jgi:hypothetical protein
LSNIDQSHYKAETFRPKNNGNAHQIVQLLENGEVNTDIALEDIDIRHALMFQCCKRFEKTLVIDMYQQFNSEENIFKEALDLDIAIAAPQ